jgi:hypothetical protein
MAYRIFWTPIAVQDLRDICDFAVTMEKQGTGQRVSGLAFVEPSVGTAP